MDAVYYFDFQQFGMVEGSLEGEPDGAEHTLELLSGNQKLIIRLKLAGSAKPVEFLLSDHQAICFTNACERILRDQKIRERETERYERSKAESERWWAEYRAKYPEQGAEKPPLPLEPND